MEKKRLVSRRKERNTYTRVKHTKKKLHTHTLMHACIVLDVWMFSLCMLVYAASA
jgi:hypothetical protein